MLLVVGRALISDISIHEVSPEGLELSHFECDHSMGIDLYSRLMVCITWGNSNVVVINPQKRIQW